MAWTSAAVWWQHQPFPAVRCRCVVHPNIKQAYANFWSGALDYQLLKNTVISFEYVGSHGVHEYSIANINAPDFGGVLGIRAPLIA